MFSFLQRLFDSPEKAALRKIDVLKKDINDKGGSAIYLSEFVEEWVNKRESAVFILSGITMSGTDEFDQQAVQLALLKDLHRARFRKQLEVLTKPPEELVNQWSELSTMLALSKDDRDYRACSGIYSYSGLFLTQADITALENSDELKNFQCGSVDEARDLVFSLIVERMLKEVANPTKKEAIDIVEEICAENALAQFFRSRAVERASTLATAFEGWLDAEMETLEALTKGIN
jgi:hypothetical protein